MIVCKNNLSSSVSDLSQLSLWNSIEAKSGFFFNHSLAEKSPGMQALCLAALISDLLLLGQTSFEVSFKILSPENIATLHQGHALSLHNLLLEDHGGGEEVKDQEYLHLPGLECQGG